MESISPPPIPGFLHSDIPWSVVEEGGDEVWAEYEFRMKLWLSDGKVAHVVLYSTLPAATENLSQSTTIRNLSDRIHESSHSGLKVCRSHISCRREDARYRNNIED